MVTLGLRLSKSRLKFLLICEGQTNLLHRVIIKIKWGNKERLTHVSEHLGVKLSFEIGSLN